jgi:hypothetical protein
MATYTLTGPGSGVQGTASTNFTVTMDATAIVGTVVVTMNDDFQGGTFTPAFLNFTTASQALTFTYTPIVTGPAPIETTNNQSYIDPVELNYTVTYNPNVVINQLLWAWAKNQGYRFPFFEITRDGGISNLDAITLRNSFDTYFTTRMARPTLVPAHPDLASAIHTTNLVGRTGRGQTPVLEDVFLTTARGIDSTGDESKGASTDDPLTGRGIVGTGRHK